MSYLSYDVPLPNETGYTYCIMCTMYMYNSLGYVILVRGMWAVEMLYWSCQDTQPRAYTAGLNMEIFWKGILVAIPAAFVNKLAGGGG
jgi:hypothetical protein